MAVRSKAPRSQNEHGAPEKTKSWSRGPHVSCQIKVLRSQNEHGAPRKAQMREHAGKHHSRHIYPCGAHRASVEESENSMTRTMMRAMTRTFQLWRASEKKPHAQKTSMGHPASRFQASPISNRHLIHCPELDNDLTCTKQTADPISNRQFFALLKLPEAERGVQSTPSAR